MAGQIGLGFASDWVEREQARALLDRHVQLGLLILALMVLRLTWRLAYPPPARATRLPPAQRIAAGATHFTLYVLLLLMPLSGYALWAWIGAEVRFFGTFTIPVPDLAGQDEFWRSVAGYTHEYAGYALLAFLALHIGAALYHELILRDGLVRGRMF